MCKKMSLLFLVLALLLHVSCVQGDCPHSWTRYGDSCYYLFEDKQEFMAASCLCETFRAHLVIMEEPDENAFVKSMILKHKAHNNVWIAATDTYKKGELRWLGTNKKVKYADWFRGEPDDNSGKDERCTIMTYWEPAWADVQCHGRYYYICEKSEDDDCDYDDDDDDDCYDD